MEREYAQHGVEFRYPAGWEVSEQREPTQLSITVASPNTCFWTLTLLPERPDPESLIAAAVAAFEDEYEELDVYPSKARLGRRATVAREIDFVCLELLNSARIRAARTARFTALVLFQGTDAELEKTAPLLEKITRSLCFRAEPPG